MPLYEAPVKAIASATDNAIVRWDGTSGQLVQDLSTATLSDADILILSDTAAQQVVAGSATTVTFAGITLSPKMILYTASSVQPNLAMIRDATAATGAPTFNFFRIQGGGAVKNGDSLGIFSGSGHDGTDQAAGAQIDIVVDEADTGTAAVGANSMGSKLRFLTSRRATQSPTLSAQLRHNGAFQLNTGITLAPLTNTGMGGSLEADTKVLYYTPEDASRGVLGAKYVICPTGTNVMTSSGSEQALFDDVGAGTLTLPTGTYLWHGLFSFLGMDAGAASNLAFDILGAGSATVTALYMSDGMEAAINTASANTASMSNAAQTPAAIIVGSANAALQIRMQGIFRITAAGTIIPSITLAVAAAATRSADSFFCCECIGTSTVQTVGAWS